MKRFFAFTLSELMIAITVLGIMCATVLPTVLGNNPNQNKMMMKKAYYTFSEVVNELINDTDLYPSYDGICPDNKESGYYGFDCQIDPAKFPFNFAHYINTNTEIPDTLDSFKSESNIKINSTDDCLGVASSCYRFESSDGMYWAIPRTESFTAKLSSSSILIGVDVNGDKKPNCYEGSTYGKCKGRTENFDRFRIKLLATGQIYINSEDLWATKAIQVDSALGED